MLRAAAIVAVVAALLAGATPARAWVLSEDELEERSTELGLLGRAFVLPLRPLFVVPGLQDPDPQVSGLFDLRLSFQHQIPWFKVVVHNQLTATIRSKAAGAGLLTMGRGVEPSRWLPLQWDLTTGDHFDLRDQIDWIYAAVTWGPATIIVGRQPITFGRGKFFKPLDLVATFALTEIDTEYKFGVDALRVDLNLFERTFISIIAVAGQWDDALALKGSSFALRAKQGWSSGEVGLLGGFVRNDAVVGLDAVWDTGGFDVYAEITVTLTTDSSLSSAAFAPRDDAEVAALVGATFKPAPKLTLTPELYYSGFGAWDPADYGAVALSERVAMGERFTLGQLYAAGFALWELHPLVSANLGAVVNLRDPSGLLSLGLRYSVLSSMELIAGAYLPLGRPPEVRQILPNQGLPTPRSEFGLYPFFFFTELKVGF
jgi:hypothetical protein